MFEEDVPMSVNVCVYVKYDAFWEAFIDLYMQSKKNDTLPQTNAETIVNTKATLFLTYWPAILNFLA